MKTIALSLCSPTYTTSRQSTRVLYTVQPASRSPRVSTTSPQNPQLHLFSRTSLTTSRLATAYRTDITDAEGPRLIPCHPSKDPLPRTRPPASHSTEWDACGVQCLLKEVRPKLKLCRIWNSVWSVEF